MTDNQTPVPFEPFFGGFVLETLTIGMYGEARNAIREYIQNGFDSIQRAIEDLNLLRPGEGLIEIELAPDKKTLIIRDNGAGLSVKTAATVLTRVGASSKNHRKNAGFRGIGRLAGIVFSNTVTFTTKAKGEREQTTVVFKAKAMRTAMAPGRGSSKSAEALLQESVIAYKTPARESSKHFFEVKLEGLTDPPDECVSALALESFVSQVAPVPYSRRFPYKAEIDNAARENNILIEEVKITIRDGTAKAKPVTKRYVDQYAFESGDIALTGCSIYQSPTKLWWAWVGKKNESGAYTDPRVRGLRVRVRNIQIDGTEIIREIFRDHAKSFVRFQDYFLGEILIEPSALVPNARRDGFEEDSMWKRVRKELASVVKSLGKEAYALSAGGQVSIDVQRKNLLSAKKELRQLQRTNFANSDKAVKLSTSITTYQKRIAKGSLGADMPTLAAFQAVGAELTDIKREILSHVGGAAAAIDREKVQQKARDELLREIMAILDQELSPVCLEEVREILRSQFGDEL